MAEVVRVLRPGGVLAGYDLIRRAPGAAGHRHRHGRDHDGRHDHDESTYHRMAEPEPLRARLVEVGFEGVTVQPSLAGVVARFRARKPE